MWEGKPYLYATDSTHTVSPPATQLCCYFTRNSRHLQREMTFQLIYIETYSFIPNRQGSPFINFRPICHSPRPLFHIPRLLIFGRIAASPVYYINSVNLMHIFGIGSRKFRMFDGESDRESESAKRKFVLSFQCSSYPTSSPPTPPLHQRHGASLRAASVSNRQTDSHNIS